MTPAKTTESTLDGNRYSELLVVAFSVETYPNRKELREKPLHGANLARESFIKWARSLGARVVCNEADVTVHKISKGLENLRKQITAISADKAHSGTPAKIAVMGYFAGHGGSYGQRHPTVFCTRSGDFPLAALYNKTSDTWTAAAHHVLWIVDCCNAKGAAMTAADGGLTSLSAKLNSRLKSRVTEGLLNFPERSTQVLSASGPGESAWFTKDKGSQFLRLLEQVVKKEGILPASLAPSLMRIDHCVEAPSCWRSIDSAGDFLLGLRPGRSISKLLPQRPGVAKSVQSATGIHGRRGVLSLLSTGFLAGLGTSALSAKASATTHGNTNEVLNYSSARPPYNPSQFSQTIDTLASQWEFRREQLNTTLSFSPGDEKNTARVDFIKFSYKVHNDTDQPLEFDSDFVVEPSVEYEKEQILASLLVQPEGGSELEGLTETPLTRDGENREFRAETQKRTIAPNTACRFTWQTKESYEISLPHVETWYSLKVSRNMEVTVVTDSALRVSQQAMCNPKQLVNAKQTETTSNATWTIAGIILPYQGLQLRVESVAD